MTCQQHFEPTKLNVIAYQSYDGNYKLSFKKKKSYLPNSWKYLKISDEIIIRLIRNQHMFRFHEIWMFNLKILRLNLRGKNRKRGASKEGKMRLAKNTFAKIDRQMIDTGHECVWLSPYVECSHVSFYPPLISILWIIWQTLHETLLTFDLLT